MEIFMKKIIIPALFGMLAFGCVTNVAKAGSINSAEQSLISTVTQSFIYNGKVYVVAGSYIAQGRNKLASDDVDLTEAQASSYAAQFNGSHQELVEEGYCVEVGESSQDDSSGDVKHSSVESAQNKAIIKEFFGKVNNNATKAEAGEGKTSDSGENKNPETDDASVADRGSVNKNTKDTAEEYTWVKEEDLGSSEDFSKKDVDAARDRKVKFSYSGKKYNINEEKTDTEKKGQKVTKNILDTIINIGMWKMISYVVIVFSAVVIIAVLCYILFVKNKGMKKRKLRFSLAVCSALAIGCLSFVLMVVLAFNFGIYSKDAVHRTLMESDYYSGVTGMTRTFAVERLNASNINALKAEEIFTLSRVYIEEKQYIDKVLSGKKENVSTTTIEDAIETELAGTDEATRESVKKDLIKIYKDTLKFELGNEISESKAGFKHWFYMIVPVNALLILVLFIITYVMYGYLHKSARTSSVAIIVPSVLIVLFALYEKLGNFSGKIKAEPIYYQQFLQKYADWSIMVGIYVGCIGILVGATLIVWKNYLHSIYVD